jgi:YVTN family beta-propeller protein
VSHLKTVVRFVIAFGLLSTQPVTPAAASFVYVANWATPGTVSVIDTTTDTVTATVPVGSYPTGVAISPDGTRGYVASSINMSVIDADPSSPTYNNESCRIPFGQGIGPNGIVVAPDGRRVYVTDFDDYWVVAVIDAASCSVMATIPLDGGPTGGIAMTPDGTQVLLGTERPNVVVIDTDPTSPTYHTILTTIPLDGDYPGAMAITPGGTRAYIANGIIVSVIDTVIHTVTTNIPVGGCPDGVAITPDGTRAYVTDCYMGHFVSVIDTASNTVVARIPVEGNCFAVTITPDGTFAYVTNSTSNDVSKVDTDPSSPTYNTVVTTILVGTHPWGLAITPF